MSWKNNVNAMCRRRGTSDRTLKSDQGRHAVVSQRQVVVNPASNLRTSRYPLTDTWRQLAPNLDKNAPEKAMIVFDGGESDRSALQASRNMRTKIPEENMSI